MNKLLLSSILAITISAVGCASVKDESGKVVGSCFGAGCVLRAAVGANIIDPKTGVMKGEIPLFSIKGHAASGVPATDTSASGNASGVAQTNNYQYTIHNFRARIVTVAKKSSEGADTAENLQGLNKRAAEEKQRLIPPRSARHRIGEPALGTD